MAAHICTCKLPRFWLSIVLITGKFAACVLTAVAVLDCHRYCWQILFVIRDPQNSLEAAALQERILQHSLATVLLFLLSISTASCHYCWTTEPVTMLSVALVRTCAAKRSPALCVLCLLLGIPADVCVEIFCWKRRTICYKTGTMHNICGAGSS